MLGGEAHRQAIGNTDKEGIKEKRKARNCVLPPRGRCSRRPKIKGSGGGKGQGGELRKRAKRKGVRDGS